MPFYLEGPIPVFIFTFDGVLENDKSGARRGLGSFLAAGSGRIVCCTLLRQERANVSAPDPELGFACRLRSLRVNIFRPGAAGAQLHELLDDDAALEVGLDHVLLGHGL